jgi:transcriptional regulator with GAF, ATPase, and Fis domain
MEFIWLAPAAPHLSAFKNSAVRVRFAVSADLLPRLIGDGDAGALIVDLSADLDMESAFAAVDRWRDRLPVWIFDPSATVASSLRWMKEGASHVATSEEEIEETMLAHMPVREVHRRTTQMVGESRSMSDLEDRIRMVADRRCTVLIEGETGTGKEVVARAIHAAGSRARGPWVAVNCGAIPEALLEAELFGHVKGAFTGAVQSRAGKFEAANRGTIFLDEIGDMPLSVQSKLLRVLQEREIERLGGNESVRLDVRVIAASNSNLAECVRLGTFRQDLFYRLNVFRLALPPLRERMQDVYGLASHFVGKICAGERLPLKTLDPSAIEKLMCHSWPGNVRELENTIEAAVISSGTRRSIFPCDLTWAHVSGFRSEMLRSETEHAPAPVLPADGLDYERVLGDFEKNIIGQALTRTRGNKTAAAHLLGLKRTTLAARMRALESRMPRLVA